MALRALQLLAMPGTRLDFWHGIFVNTQDDQPEHTVLLSHQCAETLDRSELLHTWRRRWQRPRAFGLAGGHAGPD